MIKKHIFCRLLTINRIEIAFAPAGLMKAYRFQLPLPPPFTGQYQAQILVFNRL